MIYLWKTPDYYPSELIGEYLRAQSPDRFLFRRGKPLPEEEGTPCFKFEAQMSNLSGYDVLPNNAMVPLVSDVVAKCMTEYCSADVQLIPSQITTSNGVLTNYKLVNLLHLVSGVDQSQSSFVFIPGTKQIMKFNRLRLRADCLGNHSLVRLTEYPSYIVVSAGLKQEFDSRGWKGYCFVPPEAVKP